MKKSIFKTMLAVTTALMMFSGCTSGAKATPAPASPAPATTAPVAGAESAKPTEATAEKPIKVVLVMSQLGDKSFNDSAWAGLQKLAADNKNVTVKALEVGSDATKYEPILMDVAGEYDIVVTGTFSYTEYAQKVAQQFPDTKFIHYDASLEYDKYDLKNMIAVEYKANEASFLGGYLLAKMTQLENPKLNKDKVIGFVGGDDAPVINDFLIGFIDGALAADKDSKVAVSYVGSYTDAAKGKELALNQISSGADILFQVAGGAGMGVIDAALEKDKYVLGVDSDQALIFEADRPKISEIVVSSVLKNIGNSLYLIIENDMKGQAEWGKGVQLGINEDGVGLATNKYYEAAVPAELRAEVEGLKAKILSGEIKVRSSYTMTAEQITEVRNSVKP